MDFVTRRDFLIPESLLAENRVKPPFSCIIHGAAISITEAHQLQDVSVYEDKKIFNPFSEE